MSASDNDRAICVTAESDTLKGRLLAPDTFPHLAADCEVLINAEVKGLSMALRAALGVAAKARSNIIQRGMRELIPEFVCEIEPCYADYLAGNASDFGAYVMGNQTRVADALLKVGDRRAERSRNRAIRLAYARVRGRAQREIVAAMPGIAAILGRHAG